jgi:predicted small metal-binding protein
MNDESLRVRCVCGWETSGSEEDVIRATTEHGERVHNMRPSRADVLAMVIREPDDDQVPR